MKGDSHLESKGRWWRQFMVGTRMGRARLRNLQHAVRTAAGSLTRVLRERAMCERLEGRTLLSANDPIISEFMADNTTGLMDGNGKRGDWIEIYNPGATPVDLQGWH